MIWKIHPVKTVKEKGLFAIWLYLNEKKKISIQVVKYITSIENY